MRLHCRYDQHVNLHTRHVMEYSEPVWAKVKGYPHWPAFLIKQYRNGEPVKKGDTP